MKTTSQAEAPLAEIHELRQKVTQESQQEQIRELSHRLAKVEASINYLLEWTNNIDTAVSNLYNGKR